MDVDRCFSRMDTVRLKRKHTRFSESLADAESNSNVDPAEWANANAPCAGHSLRTLPSSGSSGHPARFSNLLGITVSFVVAR